MQIRFHGAAGGVTGSCYELKDEALNCHILVDCGMVQGEFDADERNRKPFPFKPSSLTHVFLTHAHIDHVGLLPRLYKEGYRGKVYATKETQELATLTLSDSQRHCPDIYKPQDVAVIRWEEPRNAIWATFNPVGKDLFARFYRSAHIVGAVSLTLLWGPRDEQRSITFSGDLGTNVENGETLPLLGYRQSPVKANYAVVESTYGNRVRPVRSQEERLSELKTLVDAALFERQGLAIFPSFAIQRSQDILADLTLLFAREPERYADIPVFFDSAMGRQASKLMASGLQRTFLTGKGTKVQDAWLGRGFYRNLGLDYKSYEDQELAYDCMRELLDEDYASNPKEVVRHGLSTQWRRIWKRPTNNERTTFEGPGIVIAGQGMCEAGPILEWLARTLEHDQHSIIFTGYCGSNTIGSEILKLAHLPLEQRRRFRVEQLKLKETTIAYSAIKAHITKLDGYSAHADQSGLLDWMWSNAPGLPPECIADTVFITHGEHEQRLGLQEAIREKAKESDESVAVFLPKTNHGWYSLEASVEWDEEA